MGEFIMIRAFLVTFFLGFLMIYIAHNTYQTSQSKARCEQIVAQIHQHAENLNSL